MMLLRCRLSDMETPLREQEVEADEALLWGEAMAAARERAEQERLRYRTLREVVTGSTICTSSYTLETPLHAMCLWLWCQWACFHPQSH